MKGCCLSLNQQETRQFISERYARRNVDESFFSLSFSFAGHQGLWHDSGNVEEVMKLNALSRGK